MRRKTFSRASYEQNDQTGKDACIDIFSNLFGYTHIPYEKELYKKGDLIMDDPKGIERLIEVEVKRVGWTDGNFKYDSLHFAYKPDSESYAFASFNKELDNVFLAKKTWVIQERNLITKDTYNRYTGEKTYNEPFYEIKVSKCKHYRKNAKGVWEIVKK